MYDYINESNFSTLIIQFKVIQIFICFKKSQNLYPKITGQLRVAFGFGKLSYQAGRA